jgi:hypothetical protein
VILQVTKIDEIARKHEAKYFLAGATAAKSFSGTFLEGRLDFAHWMLTLALRRATGITSRH